MAGSSEQDAFARLAAPRRNRYFHGKLLGVPHLEAEQLYERHHDALTARLGLGKGVLCGLSLRIVGDTVELAPGVAVDGLGRRIIVPHPVLIDPYGEDPACPCCDPPDAVAPPSPATHLVRGPGTSTGAPAGPSFRATPRPRDAPGEVTIWLCYRECLTDHAPALVDDCAAAAPCEADTIVETYCVRLSDGTPDARAPSPGCAVLREHDPALSQAERISLRRTGLCEVLDTDCAADPQAACIPLATVELTEEGTIGAITVCPVRTRLYSNDTLLELILCLADRIEECCRRDSEPEPEPDPDPDPDPEPEDTPFRVVAVRWIASGTDGSATELDPVLPLRASVPVSGEPGEIVIDLSSDVDPDTVTPTDPNMPRTTHSVLVLNLETNDVVRGTAELTDARTITFTAERPFLQGRYRLILAGDAQGDGVRPQLSDLGGHGLDGDPIGLPSGDGTAGGDFIVDFTVE